MIKLVFFYNQYASGWSETYYAPGDDPKLFANSLTTTFMANSVKWRNATTVLKAIRLTRVTPGLARFSYLVRPYPSPQGVGVSSAENGPDVASVDAVYQLGGQAGATRRVFFRGLSDLDTRRDAFGNDIPSVNVTKGVDLFVKGMIAYQFAIKYTQKPPNGGLIYRSPRTVYAAAGNPLFTAFQLEPAAPILPVDTVLTWSGIDTAKLPGWPRNTRIIAIQTVGGVDSYVINYALPGGVTAWVPDLKGTILQNAFEPIGDHQFERFSEHKTGRPFGLLRGRASAR